MYFFLSFLLLIALRVSCDEQGDSILRHLNIDPNRVKRHDIAHVRFDPRDNATLLGFRVFGYDNNMWLHPVDSVLFTKDTPVYEGYVDDEGRIRYHPIPDMMKKIGKLYENEEYLASVVIGHELKESTANGHFSFRGHDIILRSLPEGVAKEYLRKRRSIETPTERHPHVAYHIAIELKSSPEDKRESNEVSSIKDKHHDLHPQPRKRNAPSYPDTFWNTLYPEILVSVDYTYLDYWAGPTRDNERLSYFIEYLMAFWNGVDLIYRNIENPRIRLNIAAIVLHSNPFATPYMRYLDDGTVDQGWSLAHAANFFSRLETFYGRNWDVAVTMTTWPLGKSPDPLHPGGQILGVSYGSSACDRHNATFEGYFDGEPVPAAVAQALIHDNGAFFGIPVTAHELGHVFGADHDNVTDHPDCDAAKGFLMSDYISTTKNSHSLSVCSLAQIQTQERSHQRDCLRSPVQNEEGKLPKLMPGRLKSLDAQCRALSEYYIDACEPIERPIDICVQMYCRTVRNSCVSVRIAAADGTPCPDPRGSRNGFCLQNTCTTL